ncbi:hypothetical protein CPC08DRAFT_762406 [Agrocybe pediades]|nr:hypothetical protein CPC08DRAFT_762406 [Agrocybe pediades]
MPAVPVVRPNFVFASKKHPNTSYVGTLKKTIESKSGIVYCLRFGDGVEHNIAAARCTRTNEQPTPTHPDDDEPVD